MTQLGQSECVTARINDGMEEEKHFISLCFYCPFYIFPPSDVCLVACCHPHLQGLVCTRQAAWFSVGHLAELLAAGRVPVRGRSRALPCVCGAGCLSSALRLLCDRSCLAEVPFWITSFWLMLLCAVGSSGFPLAYFSLSLCFQEGMWVFSPDFIITLLLC